MNEVATFLELFSADEQSATIEKLAHKYFEDQLWIADGVEIDSSYKDELCNFILDADRCSKYENSFVIFGQATHSGSLYAFYKLPNTENCDQWPVVVLGDEGGAVVLAKNIFDLMRFWTLNYVCPYIDTSDYTNFELTFDEEVEADNKIFKEWIKTDYGIEPLSTIEEARTLVIEPAIKEHQAEMDLVFE